MNRRAAAAAALLAVAAAACGIGSVTAEPAPPPTKVRRTPPATAATTSTVPPSTTTTLSQVVVEPDKADSYAFRERTSLVISEPGATDTTVIVEAEGVSVGKTVEFTAKEWVGERLVSDRMVLIIGNDGWSREVQKPWQPMAPVEVVGLQASEVEPTDFDVYDIVSDLDWELEAYEGGRARVYELPPDAEFDDWGPRAITSTWGDVDLEQATVWIDVDSNYVVRAEFSGTADAADVFADPATSSGEGSVLIEMEFEFTEINSPRHAEPGQPRLDVPDAPDGYYVFESSDHGFRLHAPIDWTLLPPQNFDGFAVAFGATPPADIPNDSYFEVTVEDLSASQGLRAEEYAENIMSFVAPAASSQVLRSEPVDIGGHPGWLIEADVSEADGDYRVRLVTLIDGRLGYTLGFYAWDGWFETDLEQALQMFSSFELFEPETDESA